MSVLDFVGGTGWAITEAAAETITQIALRKHEVTPEALAAYEAQSLVRGQRVKARDGVAILDVTGPLFKKASFFTSISGATSYATLRSDLQVALDDPAIHSILLNVDSPGGEANGCDELAAAIFAARSVKPITAFVSGQAASGGYWLAAAASRIVISKAAMLGSIGVVLGLTETAPRAGETKLQFVSAQSPNKRPDLSTEAGRSQIQTMVDDLAEVFINDIAKYRGVSADAVITKFGAGGIKIGAKAVAAGMADDVGDFEAVIQSMISTGKNSHNPNRSFGGLSMTTQTNGPTAEEAASNARVETQARIKAIMASENGKKLPVLASFIAFETSVSAKDADGILTAAAADILAGVEAANKARASWSSVVAASNGSPHTPASASGKDAVSTGSWSSVIASVNKVSMQ